MKYHEGGGCWLLEWKMKLGVSMVGKRDKAILPEH